MNCPFCGRDPYHYEHNGMGYEPVAINCCETYCALCDGNKQAEKILRLRQKGSPKSVARGNKIWFEEFGEGPISRRR